MAESDAPEEELPPTLEKLFNQFMRNWRGQLGGHEDPAHIRQLERMATIAWAHGAHDSLHRTAKHGDELSLAKIMSGAAHSAVFESLEYPDDDD